MNLFKFSVDVHKNAIDHGWWETDRPISETIALIHSEYSEALEEYRAGRPFIWYNCNEDNSVINNPCNPLDEADCLNVGKIESCPYRGKKPEGIAVELIDAAIRILDLMGRHEYQFYTTTLQEAINKTRLANPLLTKDTPLPELVAILHSTTAKAGDACMYAMNRLKTTNKQSIRQALSPLEAVLGLIFYWVHANGIDPEKIMLEKHEYNKTRPYKHGKLC